MRVFILASCAVISAAADADTSATRLTEAIAGVTTSFTIEATNLKCLAPSLCVGGAVADGTLFARLESVERKDGRNADHIIPVTIHTQDALEQCRDADAAVPLQAEFATTRAGEYRLVVDTATCAAP